MAVGDDDGFQEQVEKTPQEKLLGLCLFGSGHEWYLLRFFWAIVKCLLGNICLKVLKGIVTVSTVFRRVLKGVVSFYKLF